MVVHEFNCYCKDSYIQLTSRNRRWCKPNKLIPSLRKIIKKHIPKCVDNYMTSMENEKNQYKSIMLLNYHW